MNQKAKFELFQRLQALGFTYGEARQLRRIEMTLQRWAELECGTEHPRHQNATLSVERNEETGKTEMWFRGFFNGGNHYEESHHPCADRESGALRRLAHIMQKHPELTSYHQSDPRGCALYILRKADLADGDDINANYTRGLAVA